MSLSKLSKGPGEQQRAGEHMGLGIYCIDLENSEVRYEGWWIRAVGASQNQGGQYH